MATIKKNITFKKLLDLSSIIHNPQAIDSMKRDRLTFSIIQLAEYMKYPLEQYNKKLSSILQKLCSMDKDGNFYLNEKQEPIFSKFTKENQIKKDAEIEALFSEEVEIELDYCTDYTRVRTLHLSIIKELNGYLFDIGKEELLEIFIEKESKSDADSDDKK